jgi:hypothetical protein
MESIPAYQKVHDVIVVRDSSAAICAITSGADALVVDTAPEAIDLLHRPFRMWVGGREHRAHTVVLGTGDGASPAVYRDWLAHDRHGNLITDATRTSVDGVFVRGCQAARDAIAWLSQRTDAVAAALVAA